MKTDNLLFGMLGAHFFDMPFADADRLTGLGKKEFIAQLMPRHPLYINLLPKAARDVIGEVHGNTLPARKMLEDEGFRYQGYVDIFDAGPTLETQVNDIRAVRESKNYLVKIEDHIPIGTVPYLISNTLLDGYRCTMVYINVPESGSLCISQQSTRHCLRHRSVSAFIFSTRLSIRNYDDTLN